MAVADDLYFFAGDEPLGHHLGQARHHACHAGWIIHPLDDERQIGRQIDDAGGADAAMRAEAGQASHNRRACAIFRLEHLQDRYVE